MPVAYFYVSKYRKPVESLVHKSLALPVLTMTIELLVTSLLYIPLHRKYLSITSESILQFFTSSECRPLISGEFSRIPRVKRRH